MKLSRRLKLGKRLERVSATPLTARGLSMHRRLSLQASTLAGLDGCIRVRCANECSPLSLFHSLHTAGGIDKLGLAKVISVHSSLKHSSIVA